MCKTVAAVEGAVAKMRVEDGCTHVVVRLTCLFVGNGMNIALLYMVSVLVLFLQGPRSSGGVTGSDSTRRRGQVASGPGSLS